MQTRTIFLWLVVVQACHSVEEYAFRLYDVFPPARWLVTLFSDDPQRGFIIFNVAFVAFGFLCYLFLALSERSESNGPVRRGRASAIPLIWMWAIIETTNGMVHPLFSAVVGGYTPGLVTSLALLPLGLLLSWRLRRIRSRLETH